MSYFGNEWEMRISEAKAQKILGDFPIPRIGYVTDIKCKKCDYGFTHRLCINNVSGILYVASPSVPYREWVSFFDFDLKVIK